MAILYSFVDNEVYGTQDINDITSCVVGSGLAPFEQKDSYSVSDLNVITQTIVGTGTSLDGCKCSVENPGTAEMTATIGQCIIFFESGVRMIVDQDGHTIIIEPNTIGYIYAYYSSTLQKADIVYEAELPTDGEYVLLAEILEDGTLKDKRSFARSKVATMGSNAELLIDESRVTVYETYAAAPFYSETEKILAEIDLSGIDITKFNYLIYRYPYTGAGSTAPTYQEKYFNYRNNSRDSFYIKGSLYYYSGMFDIILDGTKFVIVVNYDITFGSYRNVFKASIPYFKLV